MSSRDRSLIGVIVILIVAVGGWFLIVAPERNKANSLQKQIQTERTALTLAQANVQAGLAAEAQYKTYVKQLSAIRAAVPSDDQVPQLINDLQAAAIRTHVGFYMVSEAATPSTTTTTTGVAAAFPSESFSLEFTGRYFAVANLLGTLARFVRADNKHFQASGRLLSIGSVSLAGGPKGYPQVAATISALDYDVPTALLSSGTTTASGQPAASVTG